MRIQHLFVLVFILLLIAGGAFFLLQSNFLRVSKVGRLPSLTEKESLATLYYDSQEEGFFTYPQTWIDLICRRTGRFCGEKTDYDVSKEAVKRYIEFRDSASYQPWLLDPAEKDEYGSLLIFVSSNGSDANSGAENSPFQTIDRALRSATPGSTILVSSGDYTQSDFLKISLKGTSEKPIRIIANAADVVIPPVLIAESEYLELSGFTIKGPESIPKKWIDMPTVFVDNPAIFIDRFEGYEEGRKEKIEQKYATWHNILDWERSGGTSAGIHVSSSYYITLSENDISFATYGVQLSNDSRRLYIFDNYIHHNLVGITGSVSDKNQYSFSESLIQDNLVEQSFRTGIAVHHGAHHNVIDSNEVRYSGTSNMNTYRSSGNNMFIFNVAEYGGYYTETMQYPGSSALSLHSCKKGCIAFGNYLAYQYDATGADGNGIIIDFTDQGAYIAANIMYRTQGSGITSTKSGNSMIVNNTIIEAGYNAVNQKNSAGIRTADPQRDTQNIIANNIIHNPSGGGILFQGGGGNLQKYLDYNIYSFENLPLIVNDDPTDRIVINRIEDLIDFSITHSMMEEVLFVEYKDVAYKVQVSSPGSTGSKKELMPEYNFYGEQWDNDSFGAL